MIPTASATAEFVESPDSSREIFDRQFDTTLALTQSSEAATFDDKPSLKWDKPRQAPSPTVGSLDRGLLDRALQIVEGADVSDPVDLDLAMTSLRESVANLWESAEGASDSHCQILSTLDAALLTQKDVDSGFLAGVREAIIYLGLPELNGHHVNVVESTLDVPPLALFDDVTTEFDSK